MITETPLWVLKKKEDGDIFEDGEEFEIEKFTLVEGYDGETFISMRIPVNDEAL